MEVIKRALPSGKKAEIASLQTQIPEFPMEELFQSVAILDAVYGADRDYMEVDGYVLIAENSEDIQAVKAVIDYDVHLCEWVNRIGQDAGYLSSLYVINNDFTITLMMPISIAPNTILNELED